MAQLKIENMTFEPLFTEKQLHERIDELGKQISDDYRGKDPIFVGVLNGSFLFMADLARAVDIEFEVDFIKIASYHGDLESSGEIKIIKDFSAEIKNRHILLIEDIVDSGLSIKNLSERVKKFEPASFEVVTLLWKKEATKADINLKYVGFEIPNKFVLGYGLDYKQRYRQLRDIYQLVGE
ncbi:MAG: hypoxanthine phosphoribosyltransferase [Calditrichia bacterium]